VPRACASVVIGRSATGTVVLDTSTPVTGDAVGMRRGQSDAEPPRSGVSTATAVAVLAFVGGVVPILYAWHFGALGIPRNDDWAYASAAFRFADSGTINGNTWAGMNLVGQLVLALPVVKVFGHHIAALQVEVASLGVIGLVATFDLAKQVVSPRRALFAATLVAALPMWASLSASYMTDVPAFALGALCLALGARGMEGGTIRLGQFYASLAVGLLAYTVRENAIVAPVAVGAIAVWAATRSRRRRLPIAAAIVGFIVCAAIFYVWRRSLPGFVNATPRLPTRSRLGLTAREAVQSVVLAGLVLSPAVGLAGPRRLLRSAWRRAPRTALAAWVATTAAIAVVALRNGGITGLIPGDYFLRNGSLGTETLRGARPDLFPVWILTTLLVVGAAVGVVLASLAAASLMTRGGSRERSMSAGSPARSVIALAAVGYLIACVVPVALGYTYLFDRYLLPVVPLVAILALQTHGRNLAGSGRHRIGGFAAIVALAVLGAVYGANSASFDGTKWSVAKHAVIRTGDPRLIDAGHTWNDDHAGKRTHGSLKRPCIVVRAEPRPAPGEEDVVGVGTVWGPTGTQVWVVARQVRTC
jgi:4-amino-4-deoxy-L-arabinose transferase-like glycosyltransferase